MDDTLRRLTLRSVAEDENWVSADDLLDWSIGRGETVTGFLDRFGGELAKAYYAGEVTYAVCDAIANDLYGLLHQSAIGGSGNQWPELFLEVYDAFDAGEYHRREDRSDDPVAEFTDPAIAKIIAKLKRRKPSRNSPA